MKTVLRIEGIGTEVYEGNCSIREAMSLAGLVHSEWNVEKTKESATRTEYTLTSKQAVQTDTGNVSSLPRPEERELASSVPQAQEAGDTIENTSSHEHRSEAAGTQKGLVAEATASGHEAEPTIPTGEITIYREEFLSALQVVCDITARKALMPVLGTVKIEATPTNVTITATDLELSYVTTFPAVLENNNATAFLVDAGILYKEVKALGKSVEDVVITANDRSIEINGRCVLPASLTDDFPEVPRIEGTQIPIKNLTSALACVLPAVSTDEARYILTGVCFDLSAGCLIGTDGFRLHRATVDTADVTQFVLPRRAAGILAKYGSDSVTVTGTRLSSPLVGGIFTARLIEGNYPDHTGIWPDTGVYNRVHFNAKEFLDLLPGILPVSDDAKIDMTINGRIDIEAESVTGSYKWFVPAESTLTGESQVITINSKYLVDAIRAYASSEEIEIAFPSDYAAIVVNEQALIMPIRR